MRTSEDESIVHDLSPLPPWLVKLASGMEDIPFLSNPGLGFVDDPRPKESHPMRFLHFFLQLLKYHLLLLFLFFGTGDILITQPFSALLFDTNHYLQCKRTKKIQKAIPKRK